MPPTMNSPKKTTARFKVGDSVSFLFGPQKVRATVLEDRGLMGANGRRLYRVGFDNSPEEQTTMEIPEEDLRPIEPADSTSRQCFRVRYYREPGTNKWTASTRWEGCRRGISTTGAVTYSSARWEGQTQNDENSAMVSVLVESDPRFNDQNLRDDSILLRRM